MKVADAIAHAMFFQTPLFLYHQHVTELEAILVVGQENLEAPELQESTRFKRNVRIIKECTVRRRWIIGFCFLYSGIISCGFILEFSLQNTTIVHSRGANAVLKKLNCATRQTFTPIGLEEVFQKNTEAVDSLRVPWRIIQHWNCFFVKK